MSFILNALRKSDQARQTKQVETSGHRYIEAYDEKKKKNNFPWLIILSAVNIALLGYFMWSAMQDDEGNEKEKILVAEKTVIKNKPEIKPVAELISEPPKSSIAQRIKEQNIQINRPGNRKIRVEPKNKQAIYDDGETKLAAVIDTTKKADFKAKPKHKATNNNTSSLPFLSEMSPDFKRTVPPININVFVYSKNEDERFVMLDMIRYQQGQEIAGDLMLKEIRQNSIVVEYRNRTFKVSR